VQERLQPPPAPPDDHGAADPPRGEAVVSRPAAASATSRDRAFAVLGSVALVAFCVWWCSIFRYESMMGDDVALVDYFQQKGSILRLSVLSTLSEKYRPFYFVLQHLVVRLFGGHYPLYFWLNVAVHAALTITVFGLAAHLARRSWTVALAVALLFASARFAFYEITQVVGLMEALALALVLALLWCAVRFWETGHVAWLWLTLGSASLLVFTHERYVVLAGFTALLPFASPRLSRRRKLLWAAAAFAPALIAVVVKTLAFRSPFLLGTGGQVIRPRVGEVLRFILTGCLNVLGVNLGPSHLSIRDFPDLPRANQVLGILFGAVLVLGLLLWFRRPSTSRRQALLGWALLTGPLILAASITIRQEFRWLYAPYLLTLLCWALAVGQLRPGWARPALAGLLVVAGLSNDFFLRANSGDLFFTSSQAIADSFYRGALLKYGWSGREFFVEPFGASQWIIPRTFLRQFLGDQAPPVQSLDPEVAARWTAGDLERKKIFRRTSGWSVIEVTSLYRARAILRDRAVVARLAEQLAAARVTGRHPERSMPSGWSVGEVSVDGRPGILALPDSEITFEQPVRDRNVSLVVLVGFYPVARLWGVSDGARASISVAPAGKRGAQSWTADLEPTADYQLAVVPLEACAGAPSCSITLQTVNDPGKNGGGDWVLWLEPQLVTAATEPHGAASQASPAGPPSP